MTTEAKVLTGIGIATVIIVIVAAVIFGGKTSPDKPTQTLSAEQTKNLVRADSHMQGGKATKVTLVEFGDFQCPACGAVYPTVTQLVKTYGNKITFVFRQYPLPMHNNAQPAALAAEAAGAQGKFFEMYDLIYSNQKDWSESKDALNEYFVGYAKNLKLDVDKFKADVEKKTYAKKIQQDMDDANALGVNATPTFYLNGEKIEGGLPYDKFKQKIDAALKSS